MAVLEKVRDIVATKLSVQEDQVTPKAHFEDDLAADSLDVVSLLMELEDEFDLEIPDVDAEGIHTVAEAVSYIEQRMGN